MKKNLYIFLATSLSVSCIALYAAQMKLQPSETKMMLAATEDDAAGMHEALQAGANPNITNKSKQTPLMLAATKDRAGNIQELLKANADLNMQDEHGMTALMYAAKKGNLESIMLLLNAGAQRDLKNNYAETFAAILMKYHPQVYARLLKREHSEEDQPGMSIYIPEDEEEKKRYSVSLTPPSSSTTPPGGMAIEHDDL